MNDWLKKLLPQLQDVAYQNSQYSPEYAALCRQRDQSYRAFWKTLSKEQKKRYLRYEADSNAQYAAEEEELVRQTFLLARQLYR